MSGRDFFTAAERAAMDRASVPAPRQGFAMDLVAAALADRPIAPRRASRTLWRHHRRVLIGAGALLLTSAAAAATGLLDRLPAPIPAIASVFHPRPVPTPTARPEHPRPVHQAAAAPAPVAPAVDPAVAARQAFVEQRRERVAEFRARRIAEGRPVLRPAARAAIAKRIRDRVQAMPPERREMLRERILERHPALARRQGLVPPEATPPEASEEPLARPGFERRLERRRLWRERMLERRAQRLRDR